MIIVTGGAGFVGTNLINLFIEKTKYIPPTNQKNNTGIKKESKNRKKIINLQNKRPLFIAISVLSIVSIILIIGVFTLR